MKRASVAETKMPGTGHDPRSEKGREGRDVMNDPTKSEVLSSLPPDPPKKPFAEPPPTVELNGNQTDEEDAASGKRKTRGRASEPYLTWLGQSLRQSYEETLNEPVPDSFSDLLDRLEQEDEVKPPR
jgi:hypothetical protein